MDRELQTVPAELFLHTREHESVTVEGEGKTVPKLKVDLVQKQQDDNWQLDSWGVVGLSPRGSFLTYLRGLYSETESLSLAVKHTLSEDDSSNAKLRFLVQPYFNPDKSKHYNDKDVTGPFETPVEDDYWSINGSIQLGETSFNYSEEKICLSSMGNELFGVIDFMVWCDQVRRLVCDGDTKHCTKTKADMTKAPEIKLTLGGNSFNFTHEDYVYFEDDDLQCRIGDICDQRSEDVCAKGTQVVLGKLFFEKYTPIFNLNTSTGRTSVSLVQNFKAPKERVLVWLIIGIVSAIVALLALLYIILKKRSELSTEPDDTYDEIVNPSDPDEDSLSEQKGNEKVEEMNSGEQLLGKA